VKPGVRIFIVNDTEARTTLFNAHTGGASAVASGLRGAAHLALGLSERAALSTRS
jgi:hypothetical protein